MNNCLVEIAPPPSRRAPHSAICEVHINIGVITPSIKNRFFAALNGLDARFAGLPRS